MFMLLIFLFHDLDLKLNMPSFIRFGNLVASCPWHNHCHSHEHRYNRSWSWEQDTFNHKCLCVMFRAYNKGSIFRTYIFQTHHMLPLYMAKVFILNHNGSTWWYTHIIRKHLDSLSLIWEIYALTNIGIMVLVTKPFYFSFALRIGIGMCFPLHTQIIFCKQLPLSFQPNYKVLKMPLIVQPHLSTSWTLPCTIFVIAIL
jgi:hypothetical protein